MPYLNRDILVDSSPTHVPLQSRQFLKCHLGSHSHCLGNNHMSNSISSNQAISAVAGLIHREAMEVSFEIHRTLALGLLTLTWSFLLSPSHVSEFSEIQQHHESYSNKNNNNNQQHKYGSISMVFTFIQ